MKLTICRFRIIMPIVVVRWAVAQSCTGELYRSMVSTLNSKPASSNVK